MSNWLKWAEELRVTPEQAVNDLLRGAADIYPFERASVCEFLLAILSRNTRIVQGKLLGEQFDAVDTDDHLDLVDYLDDGLSAWFLTQRQKPLPPEKKLSAYSLQVMGALELLLYFNLPKTLATLYEDQDKWSEWLTKLFISHDRDPKFAYSRVVDWQGRTLNTCSHLSINSTDL